MEDKKFGVFEPSSMAPKIMQFYKEGLPKGFSTGFEHLDRFYTVRPGEMTILTGTPGSGKSSFLDQLLVNTSVLHGWIHGMFTPENQPYEMHVANLLEKYNRKPFREGPHDRMTPEEVKTGMEILRRHFRYIHPDRFTLHNVFEGIKWCAKGGLKTVTLDPWADVDKERARNQSETEYINDFLTEARNIARQFKIHLFIVAHPKIQTKQADGQYGVVGPYDISGSAHWNNKADCILSIWRDMETPGRSVVHVKKIRFRDIGTVTPPDGVEFSWNKVDGTYSEFYDAPKGDDQ